MPTAETFIILETEREREREERRGEERRGEEKRERPRKQEKAVNTITV